MIGSGFLGSSVWSSDLFSKDFLPSSDPFVFDIEVRDYIATDSTSRWEEQCSTYSGSPVHSSTSEDCDWPLLGDDIDSILPVTDSLASDLLLEEAVVDTLDLNDLDWVSLSTTAQDDRSTTSNASETSSIPTRLPRKRRRTTKPAESKSSSKSWAKMNSKERLNTANALTEIISCHMSFSEQMDIIKIINPRAELSPSATEFVINLSHLNDTKLKRICGYLTERTNNLLDSSLMSFSKAKSRSSSSAHRAKRKPKKWQNKSSVNELSEFSEEKVIKQGEKEKRSGFFVKEEIMKLSNPQEDEDVDVEDDSFTRPVSWD